MVGKLGRETVAAVTDVRRRQLLTGDVRDDFGDDLAVGLDRHLDSPLRVSGVPGPPDRTPVRDPLETSIERLTAPAPGSTSVVVLASSGAWSQWHADLEIVLSLWLGGVDNVSIVGVAPAVKAPARSGVLGSAAQRRLMVGAGAVARAAPVAIIALAGLLLLWSRFLPLTQSLWSDEAYSAVNYILPGPGGVFGHYIPNDHMLFELLAWATTNLTGSFNEPTMRFWSVVPAIAAWSVMTWWLWRRLDKWVAAVFAVLAATAPLYLTLSVEARGYGLAYLAAVLMLIGMDSFMWSYRRRYLALFTGSAIAGIWTLPVFVLAFIPLVGLIATRPLLRRQALFALVIVGAGSLLFYLPVLGDVMTSSGQQFGVQLPWHGVVTAPLTDLISPSVTLLLQHVSLTVTEIIGGSLIAAGVAALWLVPERYLALALVTPTLFSYAFLEVGRFYEADRFVSFLELPLLALCAIALVRGGRLLAKLRFGRWLAIAGVVGLCLFALGKAESAFKQSTRLPIENFKEVAALVRASGIPTVITNSTKPIGFQYYLGSNGVRLWNPRALEPLFCSNVAPFVYLEHGRSPLPNAGCLRRRGAISVGVPQTRSYIHVWFVTTIASAGAHPALPVVSPILEPVRPTTSITTCPTVAEANPGVTGARAPTPRGQELTVNLASAPQPVKATVALTVIGSSLVQKVTGAFAAAGTSFVAPARFLMVRYRISNLGPTLIKPEETVNQLFGVGGLGNATIMSAGAFDGRCSLASTSAALQAHTVSPSSHLASGETTDTVALYPLPEGLARGPGGASNLTWSSSALGASAALPPPFR
jgi:hypothetical protein